MLNTRTPAGASQRALSFLWIILGGAGGACSYEQLIFEGRFRITAWFGGGQTMGDVNGDGAVNANDALTILRYALGLTAQL